MNNCPTGYCGNPCLCSGALDHLSRTDALDMGKLAMKRVEDIDAKEMSDKYGELMLAVPAVEVRLVAMKYNGAINQCDHLLERIILRKENDCIRTLSGMRTVLLDPEGNPTFVRGYDPRSNTKLRFEILEWKGEVSASVESYGSHIEQAYIKLVNTTVFLPADME